MNKQHHYKLTVQWTGNTGEGTLNYKAFERSHTIIAEHKPEIQASSDPLFRGDKTKYNPEEMLVASISSCHMLWYLHLCSTNGIVVTDYTDHATGTMTETENGGGKFTEITLHPMVSITDAGLVEKANALHQQANALCFIANSVNFPVHHLPVCKVQEH